ncbi:MAG TPA: histidinol dehydrogenase [Terriglobales bacterium]|nr:histidinol dehydrogenase [Terriglobales bacterium]
MARPSPPLLEIVRAGSPGLERRWREAERASAAAERVAERIVRDVRRRGDAALAEWSRRFPAAGQGRYAPGERVSAAALAAAWRRTPPALRRALRQAAGNIRRMAEWQKPRPWMRRVLPGVCVGQLVRAIESVGCYVPGGRYPLPSTLLMTALPARTAGVPRVVVACPSPADAVLAAAHLAGVEEFRVMGGAQAIAALAYGTRTLAPVAKIVGPGNEYVTAAKRLVAGDCEIDFAAGPTEVLWLARGGENPAFIAADLIAQAEHDPRAAAWLVTPAGDLARAVQQEVERQMGARPNAVAAAALRRRSAIILARDWTHALALADRLAPEHLTLPAADLAKVHNAGSVFLGDYAPQAVGDYLSGTNHVLPTQGRARLRGGLSVTDFLKLITVQRLTKAGLRRLALHIVTLAEAEGLHAHAGSVAVRLQPAAQRTAAATLTPEGRK